MFRIEQGCALRGPIARVTFPSGGQWSDQALAALVVDELGLRGSMDKTIDWPSTYRMGDWAQPIWDGQYAPMRQYWNDWLEGKADHDVKGRARP